MKDRMLKYVALLFTVVLLCAMCPMPVQGALPGWEYTSQSTIDIPSAESAVTALTDVTAHDGYIYVTVARPVSVRVINILGQTISSQTLPRGTSRLRTVTRGVYIVRAENISRRVTV